MAQIPLIIDCDPGVDDAIALFLAFASPELELLGVTTVGGNVSGALTARNARLLRQLAKREDVPVHAGCARPMVREVVEAGHFHGESGLGPVEVFEPSAPLAEGHGVQFLIDQVMSRPPRTVTLAVMGPMTNVAMAMVLEEGFASRLKQIVAMGGARTEGGNITASAEFNIYADPHAAHVVANSGAPLIMLGLDATHQVRLSEERIAAMRAHATPVAEAAAVLFAFCQETAWVHSQEMFSPLHDPCTIAWLLEPQFFRTRPCKMTIEMTSGLTMGHTAVEFRGADDSPIHWVIHVDGGAVLDLIIDRIARL